MSFFRLFVDVKNGGPFPRKSILKSRSRENSVCSDTSESSAADFEERRAFGRSFSHDDMAHSDTSDGITEEDSPTAVPVLPISRFEVNHLWLSLHCFYILEQTAIMFLRLVFNLNYSLQYSYIMKQLMEITPWSLRSLNENITKLTEASLS